MDDVMKDLMKSLIQHLRKLEAEDKMSGEESEIGAEDLEMGLEGDEMQDDMMLDEDEGMDEDAEEMEEDEPQESLQDRMRREMKGSNHPPEAALSMLMAVPKKPAMPGMDMAKKMVRKK